MTSGVSFQEDIEIKDFLEDTAITNERQSTMINQPQNVSRNNAVSHDIFFYNIQSQQFWDRINCNPTQVVKKEYMDMLLFRNFLQYFDYTLSFEKIHYIFSLFNKNWIQAVK